MLSSMLAGMPFLNPAFVQLPLPCQRMLNDRIQIIIFRLPAKSIDNCAVVRNKGVRITCTAAFQSGANGSGNVLTNDSDVDSATKA